MDNTQYEVNLLCGLDNDDNIVVTNLKKSMSKYIECLIAFRDSTQNKHKKRQYCIAISKAEDSLMRAIKGINIDLGK